MKAPDGMANKPRYYADLVKGTQEDPNSASGQLVEEAALMDCGCGMERRDEREVAYYQCPTHTAALELRLVVEELVAEFDTADLEARAQLPGYPGIRETGGIVCARSLLKGLYEKEAAAKPFSVTYDDGSVGKRTFTFDTEEELEAFQRGVRWANDSSIKQVSP